MIGNTMWNGIKNFSSEVSAAQLDSIKNLPGEPGNSVLISIPYLPYVAEDLEKIRGFVEGGGTLLLADDYGYGNQVLERLGVQARFDGRPLLDPLFCYKNQWMPKVIDFTAPGNFKTLILNHATALNQVPFEQVIAWSEESSYIDSNENQAWDKGESKGRLPVVAQTRVGKGVVIIISDPSLMINTMIGQADNRAFIVHLLGSQDNRKNILFDISHLSQTPLDVSKSWLDRMREIMREPYPLLAVILVIIIGISIWMTRIGDVVGKQPQNS